MKEKEANNRAWEAMSLKFSPPPNEEEVEYFDELSERHLPCLDAKTNSFLRAYGSVRAMLYRLCPIEMEQANKPTGESRLEPQTDLPLEQTDDLLKYAFEHPVDFLGYCGEALAEGADRIPDDDETMDAEIMRDILPEFADSVPMLQKIVQERFAEPLCV
jgi:hypothetical protein